MISSSPLKAILSQENIGYPIVTPLLALPVLLVSADEPSPALLHWLKSHRLPYQWVNWNVEDLLIHLEHHPFIGIIAVGTSESTTMIKRAIAPLSVASSLPILWFHTKEGYSESVAEAAIESQYGNRVDTKNLYFQSVCYEFEESQQRLSKSQEAMLNEAWQNAQRWRNATVELQKNIHAVPTMAIIDAASELLILAKINQNGEIIDKNNKFNAIFPKEILSIEKYLENSWSNRNFASSFQSIKDYINVNGKWHSMINAHIGQEQRWLDTVIFPHPSSENSQDYLVMIRDLTKKFELERQVANLEQNEEILRAELMHRMNNMQARHHCLFDFLIDYYPHPFVEAAGREFQELIQVEKLIYERLIHVKQLARIHFGQLICAIINHYKDSRRHSEKAKNIRFSLNFPEDGLLLNVDKAQLLAFILNILIENAVNHLAVINTYDKLITVTVEKLPTELMLIIEDNGFGFNLDMLKEKTTFGFMQLDLNIKQLNARLEVASDSDGTRYEITWPI